MKVWLLWHIHRIDSEEEEFLIGVYSSEENARQAVARLRDQPGFKDHPEGFQIFDHELDRDGWAEGFITVTPEEM